MTAALFTNNASTTLSADITSSATSFNVTSGAAFPVLSGGDYFYCTLVNSSNAFEIVKVTARASGSNTFTVVRAQEGTTAIAFTAAATKVELRPTAAGLNSKFDKDGGTVTGATTFSANVTLVGTTLTIPSTLSVSGGTANYTVGLQLAGSTVTTAASTATFTNKTFDTAGTGNVLKVNGNSVTASAGTAVITVPNTSGTLATLANAETFTNKTITGLKAASTINDKDTSGTAYAIGFKEVPQNARTATYTLVLEDSGKHISITTGGVTIPANGTVAFPIGTAIVVYNNSSASQTITITTDTLYLAGTATTGTRTLAQRGIATIMKVDTAAWVITGAGLT
jgi:hypothetical protein